MESLFSPEIIENCKDFFVEDLEKEIPLLFLDEKRNAKICKYKILNYLECSHCFLHFENLTEFNLHKKICGDDNKKVPSFTEKREYRCNHCGEKKDSQKTIKAHIEDFHKESFPRYEGNFKKIKIGQKIKWGEELKCYICNKNFSNRRCYLRHMNRHMDKTYKCVHCPYENKQISNVKYHLFTNHKEKL